MLCLCQRNDCFFQRIDVHSFARIHFSNFYGLHACADGQVSSRYVYILPGALYAFEKKTAMAGCMSKVAVACHSVLTIAALLVHLFTFDMGWYCLLFTNTYPQLDSMSVSSTICRPLLAVAQGRVLMVCTEWTQNRNRVLYPVVVSNFNNEQEGMWTRYCNCKRSIHVSYTGNL
jgi:hypothetical protein